MGSAADFRYDPAQPWFVIVELTSGDFSSLIQDRGGHDTTKLETKITFYEAVRKVWCSQLTKDPIVSRSELLRLDRGKYDTMREQGPFEVFVSVRFFPA